MESIFKPNTEFNFSKLSLGQPQPLQGGSYYTKLIMEGNEIYVQFPKCKTKQGLIQTERKIYTDLLYETDINAQLSEWLENLESTCQKIIYEKRNIWFTTELEMNDIETAFNSIGKIYKSGKFLLVRTFIHTNSNIKYKSNCVVYDEDENILTLQDIDANKEIIPLIKLDGIRFSSKSFQIELIIKQIMVLKEQEETIVNKFLIKRGDNHSQNNVKSALSLNQELGNTIAQSSVITKEPSTSSNELIEYNIDLENDEPEHVEDANDNNGVNYDDAHDIASGTDDDYNSDSDEASLESLEDINDIENIHDIKDIDNVETIKKKEISSMQNQSLIKPIQTEIKNKSLEMNDTKQLIQSDNTISHATNNYSINCLDEYTIDLDEESNNKLDHSDELDVVNISYETTNESIKLRNPNEVYYEIYTAAREKAKRAKKMAVEAYLEAKNIKTKYMLDDLDESDDDEDFS